VTDIDAAGLAQLVVVGVTVLIAAIVTAPMKLFRGTDTDAEELPFIAAGLAVWAASVYAIATLVGVA